MGVDKNKHVGYGELQYEYSDAKSILDAPTKLTLGEIICNAYLILIAVGMLVWYMYSAITHSINEGFVNAFLSGGHLIYLVFLLVIELIIYLTVFHLWAKFMRFALRRNLVNRQEPSMRELESEFINADANKSKENALYVYTSYVVVVNHGRENVFNREVLRSVSAKKTGKNILELEFFLKDGNDTFNILLPYTDIIKLRKIFSGLLFVKSEVQNIERNNEAIGAICFGGLFILIGIMLIISYFTFFKDLKEVPLLFGIIFLLSV